MELSSPVLIFLPVNESVNFALPNIRLPIPLLPISIVSPAVVGHVCPFQTIKLLNRPLLYYLTFRGFRHTLPPCSWRFRDVNLLVSSPRTMFASPVLDICRPLQLLKENS
jgi:hypothetical protein